MNKDQKKKWVEETGLNCDSGVQAHIDEHYIAKEEVLSGEQIADMVSKTELYIYTKEQVLELIGEDRVLEECNGCRNCEMAMECEGVEQDRRYNKAKQEIRDRL